MLRIRSYIFVYRSSYYKVQTIETNSITNQTWFSTCDETKKQYEVKLFKEIFLIFMKRGERKIFVEELTTEEEGY